MTWVAVGTVAVAAVSSANKNAAASGQVNATNTIGTAQAAADNLLRGANNELAAKRSSLARYTKSINAQRVMKQTGSAAEAALVNYRRSRDVRANDTLDMQIGAAEGAGAALAASGSSGLVGGVADVVNTTSALRRERIAQRWATTEGQVDYDAAKQQGNILRAGLQSVDTSDISTDLDAGQTVYTPQTHQDTFLMDVAGALVQSKALPGLMQKGGEAFGSLKTAATYGTNPFSQQTEMLRKQDQWF